MVQNTDYSSRGGRFGYQPIGQSQPHVTPVTEDLKPCSGLQAKCVAVTGNQNIHTGKIPTHIK